MSTNEKEFALSRILVALDASSDSIAALEAAATLAARMHAELAGLFVEDIALLRLAESPFAREVLYFSLNDRAQLPTSMEAKVKFQCEQAKGAFARAAEHARVRWTFRSVRGDITSIVSAAAAQADLLALGTRGWGTRRENPIESEDLSALRRAIPVLLLAEAGESIDGVIAVYYDGSPGAERGLLAAAHLARLGKETVVVFLAAKDSEASKQLRREAEVILNRANVPCRYRQTSATDEFGLVKALKNENSGTIILGGRDAIEKFERLEKDLRDRKVVFLLFDGTPE